MTADLLCYANIKPAVNQVEIHPFNAQIGLVEFLIDYEILPMAYRPLAKMNDIGDVELLKKIAKKYGKTVP